MSVMPHSVRSKHSSDSPRTFVFIPSTLLAHLRSLILNFSIAQVSAGAGSVVDYGLMIASHQLLGLPLFWAIALGGTVGAVINFTLNRYWTFRSKDSSVHYSTGLSRQVLRFALTVLGSILLKYLGTYSLERYAAIDYKLGKLIADLFVSVLFNYTLQRFWVFRKSAS